MNRFLEASRLKTMALIFLGGLMILLAGSLINNHSTAPSVAENVDLRTLTVTGTGKIAIETTLTEVRLGVEVEGETAREAQEEAARRSTAVVELLQERIVICPLLFVPCPSYFDKLSNTFVVCSPVTND